MTHYICTARVVTQTQINVTLYLTCLSFSLLFYGPRCIFFFCSPDPEARRRSSADGFRISGRVASNSTGLEATRLLSRNVTGPSERRIQWGDLDRPVGWPWRQEFLSEHSAGADKVRRRRLGTADLLMPSLSSYFFTCPTSTYNCNKQVWQTCISEPFRHKNSYFLPTSTIKHSFHT